MLRGGGVVENEDEAPDHPAAPVSKPGDLFELGKHRLLCGDATSMEDVDRLMGGIRADMVWTDPPYNVTYQGKTKDALTIQNDEMDAHSFRKFLMVAFSRMIAVTKEGGPFYIAHADTEGYNFRGAIADAGWSFRQCLVWAKNTLVLGRQDYHWQHEPILYGWKPGASHIWESDRKQTTLLNFDKPARNAEHPTMKPVALIEYCIRNSSRRGDTILDLFAGSGTTAIACEKTGRAGRLMEIDPKYCDVIVARWEAFTGCKAKRLTA